VFSWGWGVAAVFWISYNILGICSVFFQLFIGYFLGILGNEFTQNCIRMIQRYGKLHHNLHQDTEFPDILLPFFLEKISTETTSEDTQDQDTGLGPEEATGLMPNLGPFMK
jgi:hypothetical protein